MRTPAVGRSVGSWASLGRSGWPVTPPRHAKPSPRLLPRGIQGSSASGNRRAARRGVGGRRRGLHQRAVTGVRQAAEVAAFQDQPAVEVLALHTAVCFGDRTVTDRLAQLASQVDGPRAPAADVHAAALAATTRAHRLIQACEGARTPALTAIAVPLPLTNREREIGTLAASGLSNRQIAQRLVVSVRTVEGHLYRACAKLGASDRAQLTALLRGD